VADLGVAIVSSVAAGGFALLGAGAGDWRTRRREKESFRTETALELAGMERHIWGDDWVELRAHIERQTARMAVAGVSSELIAAFEDISHACWRDCRHNIDEGGEQGAAISTELLDARSLVHRALRAQLLGEAGKVRLLNAAVAASRSVLKPDV
jgi:hypothetical protein